MLAGVVNPYSSAISGQKEPSRFYKLGSYEVELFKKLGVIQKSYRTLEIGCGPGRIQWTLIKNDMNLEVYGTDFSPSMIRLAKNAVPNAHFTTGNGKNLHQYEDNFFDLVYSFVVFQHVEEKIFYGYLREAHRVLKPGGFLVFQIQSSEGMTDYHHPHRHPWLLRRYTRGEIKDFLRSFHFSNIKLFDMQGNADPIHVDESGFLFKAQRV